MKQSGRAKRMARKHARNTEAGLNLTALMDIFTILVFFLMVNSGDATKMTDTENLKMPTTVAKEAPKENLVLQVSTDELIIQGSKIADISDFSSGNEKGGKLLSEELKFQSSRQPDLTEKEVEFGRAITIQADSRLPYSILKQIMATCATSEYRDIALAANQVAAKAGEK